MTTPLHGGKAPAWLFGRMKLLAREILGALAEDHDATIATLKRAVESSRMGASDRLVAIRRLARFYEI